MTSRKIKITGEIILIISFVTQTLMFDYYNDKSKSLSDAFMAQAMVEKGAELKEIKYFVAKEPLDSISRQKYQGLNISLAAQKIAIAKTFQIIGLDTTKQTRVDMCNELMQSSFKVHNFNDYRNFIDTVSAKYSNIKTITNQIDKINTRKAISRWIFWLLYLTGSVLLVLATIREKEKM